MNFLRTHWFWLSTFAVLVVAVVSIFSPLTPRYPYPYDSADYMYAGTQGFLANYMDRGSLSIPEMVSMGTQLVREPEKRSEFSREIRQRRDMGFYRHYHGPMFAYWIALCGSVGVSTETAFRNAGFVVHVGSSLILMLAFWSLFPAWPRVGGLMAGSLLLFNRTALVTTVEITQHLVFLPLAILTLWSLGMFARTIEARWWYVTSVLVGLCFVAVETTVLLVATIAVVLLFFRGDIARQWPGWRARLTILAKGIGLMLLTVLVVWPAGILKLGLVRGFAYLGYMALSRKTFSPGSALRTWQYHFDRAPFEHWMLLTGLVLALILWRKMAYRRESLPWLIYAFCYIAITTKITLEFTHYRGTISMVAIMATSMAIAHLWAQWGSAGRVALVVLAGVGLSGESIRYYEYLGTREQPPTQGMVDYVRSGRVPENRVLYVPFTAVPTLHFYYPEMKVVGYNPDWPVDRLVSELRAADTAPEFLCEAPVCQAVAQATGGQPAAMVPLSSRRSSQPLYSMNTPGRRE